MERSAPDSAFASNDKHNVYYVNYYPGGGTR